MPAIEKKLKEVLASSLNDTSAQLMTAFSSSMRHLLTDLPPPEGLTRRLDTLIAKNMSCPPLETKPIGAANEDDSYEAMSEIKCPNVTCLCHDSNFSCPSTDLSDLENQVHEVAILVTSMYETWRDTISVTRPRFEIPSQSNENPECEYPLIFLVILFVFSALVIIDSILR